MSKTCGTPDCKNEGQRFAGGFRGALCEECMKMPAVPPMTAQQERVARRKVNAVLIELGRVYHDGLPISGIDALLTSNGFDATEPAIYCGRDGSCSPMQVGERTWLSLSWHKMESGRYEVTAYVS